MESGKPRATGVRVQLASASSDVDPCVAACEKADLQRSSGLSSIALASITHLRAPHQFVSFTVDGDNRFALADGTLTHVSAHRQMRRPGNRCVNGDTKADGGLLLCFVSVLAPQNCGTPQYLAPEILIENGGGAHAPTGYTKAVDCWSLGQSVEATTRAVESARGWMGMSSEHGSDQLLTHRFFLLLSLSPRLHPVHPPLRARSVLVSSGRSVGAVELDQGRALSLPEPAVEQGLHAGQGAGQGAAHRRPDQANDNRTSRGTSSFLRASRALMGAGWFALLLAVHRRFSADCLLSCSRPRALGPPLDADGQGCQQAQERHHQRPGGFGREEATGRAGGGGWTPGCTGVQWSDDKAVKRDRMLPQWPPLSSSRRVQPSSDAPSPVVFAALAQLPPPPPLPILDHRASASRSHPEDGAAFLSLLRAFPLYLSKQTKE